ncbi:MAG: cysteine peptidase family C39 domain-containing protein [Chloroflexota bacterium]|nr:cysteine peptidase family C39 domain-containing protein [Chloroflexota bacterium]
MVDVDALQNLVDHMNQKAKKFSDAAKTILDGAQSLDSAASDLTTNPASWVGKGAKAFQLSWIGFHSNALNSALHLDATSQVLSKFASQLQDHVDKIRDLQAQMAGMAVLTIGLSIADVVQLGLDPVTDAATAGAGGGDAAIMTEINAEEDAIASLDGTIAGEIDAVTAEIESSIPLDQLELPADQVSEFTQLEDDFTGDANGFDDPTLDKGIDLSQGGIFPEDQRLPYDPSGSYYKQLQPGSCIASCDRMILSDAGIDLPEAYIRDAANIDANDGGLLSDNPDALQSLGLPTQYTFEQNVSIDELTTATNGGRPAIASISTGVPGGAHAVVIDGVENGEVLIRDPLGESYKVSIENFLKLWNGKAVLPGS